MAIAPNQEELLAAEIRRIYEDSELRLLQMIAKRIVSGPDDIAAWQTQKLLQLADLLSETRGEIRKLNATVITEVEKVIELAYLAGNQSAVDDLTQALEAIKAGEPMPESIQLSLFPNVDPADISVTGIDATIESMMGINEEAVRALAGATTQTLLVTHVPIVRAVEDIYRQVVTQTVGSVLTGVETRREATQRILNNFADRGVKVFTDKAGRNWEMATYSEMATRTAVGQASLQGHMDQQTSFGFDLVQISDHKEECDLCRPWEGKVLSVSGNDPKHKPLSAARAAGLFHPNCGHRGQTYFEGLTTPLTNTKDPAGYKEKQQQRYLERGIRKYKKRLAVAQTDQAKQAAQSKVDEWNDRMDEFIEETDRRRKREREQINRAR